MKCSHKHYYVCICSCRLLLQSQDSNHQQTTGQVGDGNFHAGRWFKNHIAFKSFSLKFGRVKLKDSLVLMNGALLRHDPFSGIQVLVPN